MSAPETEGAGERPWGARGGNSAGRDGEAATEGSRRHSQRAAPQPVTEGWHLAFIW